MAHPRRKRLAVKIISGLFGLGFLLLAATYILAVTHKKEILERITDEFNEKLTGEIKIEKMDFTIFEEFPNFSIRLNNISVTDSLSATRGNSLLKADEISCRLDLLKLFTGSVHFNTIKISDATIHIVKDRSGRMNTPKPRTADTATAKNESSIPFMRKISLHNVYFELYDSVKMKNFGFVIREVNMESFPADSVRAYDFQGTIHFDGLVFNQPKGGYLTNQDLKLTAKVAYNPEKKLLSIDDGRAIIQKEHISLLMRMNFATKKMQWRIDAKSATASMMYSILPPLIGGKLSNYQLSNPLMTRVLVTGSFAPGSKPAVDIYFKSTNTTLNVADRSFENLKLLGWFTNHIDSTKINDDHNSKIVFPVFSGTIYGLPIQSQLVITDLLDPNLFMKASVSYDEKSEGIITTERFRVFTGQVKVNFVFNAPLVNYIDTVHQEVLGQLYGDISIKDVSVDQLNTGYQFRNIHGHLSFNKPDLIIDSIGLSANGNEAKVTGYAIHFVSFIFIPSQAAYVNLEVAADTVDFNSFKKPPAAASEAKKLVRKKSKSEFVPSLMDWMAGSIQLDMNLTANKIIFKRFIATNVKSDIVLTNDFVKIKNASMSTSGGQFSCSGGVDGLSGTKHALNFEGKIKGAKMNDLMYSFDDFNQKIITHKNVFGTLTASASITSRLSSEYNVVPASVSGSFKLSIRNGELVDVEGLQKISKYIFKNRDFDDVQFADLNNVSSIKGALLDIDDLNIFSSVLTLFIEGYYDLNKTNTDLLIKVPFSNLKKMDAEQRMQQTDSTAKKGGSLVIRATYTDDGNLKLSPVIFGKKKKS